MIKLMFNTLFMLFLFGFPLLHFTHAQKVKGDKIILLNGQVKEGQITAIRDEDVWFMHRGESVNSKFKKSNIYKLEFGSGRTELLNEPITRPAEMMANYREKTVAVLPIFYIGEGTGNRTDGTKYKLQQEVYGYLRKEARELKLQDPYETNALLLKNGVEEDTFCKYTSAELARMLGVEYIITGNITQEQDNSSTFSNTGSNENTKVETGKNRQIDIKDEGQSGNYRATNIEIKASVGLSVYNIRGENIFNQSRESEFTTVDAYKNSLRFLLKRTPVYGR
jgi:hypothetical protein